MKRRQYHCLTSIALILSLSGCANLGRDYGTLVGCGVGAIAGAGLGYLASGNAKGALIGASAGTATGCLAGSIWQSHQKKLEAIARQENLNLKVETLYSSAKEKPVVGENESGLVSTIESSQMFSSNSASLTRSGRRQMQSIARVFGESRNSKTHKPAFYLVIGHTDATGTAEYNKSLSERRARAVGQLLTQAGVSSANIYYQGAGASRPLGDNTTYKGRARNRRVEIVEVANKKDLLARIKSERSNVKYLVHGTLAKKPSQKIYSKKSTHKTNKRFSTKEIDFGGKLVATSQWTPSAIMTPKSSGLQIISSAQASILPATSCFYDSARVSGKVKNLATGGTISERHKTRDYLPGMNGRVWANTVNGNLVTLAPVKILKENATVIKNPLIQIVKNYDKGSRKTSASLRAKANTYEGENTILYRVFVNKKNAPISCMDIVINKSGGTSVDGRIYYQDSNKMLLATFKPHKT